MSITTEDAANARRPGQNSTQRKDATMRNYETETRLRVFPMMLVLAIALAALLIIGNVHDKARAAGEEIPQTGSAGRATRAVVQYDEPAVYLVEPRLMPA
jgi:hypothetical protein